MDTESAEERYQLEPVDHLTAETIFDARWAMTVLGEAMSRLRWAYAATVQRDAVVHQRLEFCSET